MTTAILKQASALEVSDRIKLVEDLWNTISEDAHEVPLKAFQKAELDRRLEAMEREPNRGIEWNEAARRIRRRK